MEKKFKEFVEVVYRLRKECPWDKEQTNQSIMANTIEEAYEVVESIEDNNDEELKKELGDLLLHVVFHTVIAEERKSFGVEDVITGITDKLICRHPHVFGDVNADDSETVKKNWEMIKMSEGRKSVIDGIPKHLPALIKASRIQEKAAKVGFDWQDKRDVWKKVEEELAEFRHAEAHGTSSEAEEEFGDLLFALVNYSRFVNIDAEHALRGTVEKFSSRFRFIEEELGKQGTSINDASFEAMDALWEAAKKRK